MMAVLAVPGFEAACCRFPARESLCKREFFVAASIGQVSKLRKISTGLLKSPLKAGSEFVEHALIQAAEEPQRDSVAIPHFHIVDGQVTVGQVGDLVEGFLCAAYFKQEFVAG